MRLPTASAAADRRSRADIQPLLDELKVVLKRLYGERLVKLVLYGSFARGEATDTSDVDVLVVLRGAVDEWAEIKRMSHVVQAIALRYEALIAKLPVAKDSYETRQSPLFINIRSEGIEL